MKTELPNFMDMWLPPYKKTGVKVQDMYICMWYFDETIKSYDCLVIRASINVIYCTILFR